MINNTIELTNFIQITQLKCTKTMPGKNISTVKHEDASKCRQQMYSTKHAIVWNKYAFHSISILGNWYNDGHMLSVSNGTADICAVLDLVSNQVSVLIQSNSIQPTTPVWTRVSRPRWSRLLQSTPTAWDIYGANRAIFTHSNHKDKKIKCTPYALTQVILAYIR